jgi:hypothetical protein
LTVDVLVDGRLDGQKKYSLGAGDKRIDLARKGIDKVDASLLAAWLKQSEVSAATVEVIKLDGNLIGYPSKVSLKPGATTGVEVKKGVFATVDERVGEVIKDSTSGMNVGWAQLKWIDDGTEKNYEVDKLTSVVASRADLIEDYSHIQALGEAISGSQVKQISLAQCKFTSATLTTFVQSVRWDTAALNSLTIDSTGVPAQHDEYGDLVYGTGPKTYTLTAGEDQIELSQKNLGSVDVALLTTWLQRPEVIAAVTKVDIRDAAIDEEALDTFKGAVPEGCDVVWEPPDDY